MNVLIDALSIRKQKAGVGIYARNLIEQLVGINTVTHFFLLLQDDDPEMDFGDRPNVTVIRVKATLFRRLPLRMAFEQIALPLLLLKHKIDVLHSLHYSFPLLRFGTRQVVTIHDMTSFLMPEVHVPIKTLYFRFFIRAARYLADAAIFVSHSTQRDFSTLVGPLKGIGAVIHLAKGSEFIHDQDPDRLRQVRLKYSLPQDFLLYVGTIEPRKNLTALVKAFANLLEKHPVLHLILAGGKGWKNEQETLLAIIQQLKLQDRVHFLGFIDEEDKPQLLACAAVFVYPSVYEGFGLPVLEAMACGVPTVSGNSSSLPEVAGDGAILVDATDIESLANAIGVLLVNDMERLALRARGILQASKFTWRQTAESTLKVYEAAWNSRD